MIGSYTMNFISIKLMDDIHSLAIKKVLVLIYNCDSIYCNIFAFFAHCGMYDNDK